MCGWLSLTQKSSIGSCRLHWIRSQEISFDKPIVFAPKSQDTPKGNRESFFGRKHFENILCIGRISMHLIFDTSTKIISSQGVQHFSHFSCFRPPDVQQSDPRRQRPWPRLTQGCEKDEKQIPSAEWRDNLILKAWVPHGAMNGSRDQTAWHDAKLRKLEVWWVCCITVVSLLQLLCTLWFVILRSLPWRLPIYSETVLINWSKRATRHVQLAEYHEGKAIILKDPVFVHYCSKMQKGESGAKQILRCIQICLARSRRVCSVDRNQSASCLVRILTSDRPISSVAINTKLLEIRCVKAHDEMLLCRLQH